MTRQERQDRLSAFLDGELSPPDLAELTGHLADCSDCRAHLAELGALRAALADAIPLDDVSPAFRSRITTALENAMDRPSGTRPTEPAPVLPFRPPPRGTRRRAFAAGVVAAAVAAMLILGLLPHQDNRIDLAAVRDAALRGTLSLPAPESGSGLALPGYQRVAARADIIAGHAAEVLVFTRDSQILTLCIWKAKGEAAHGMRDAIFRGMHIRYWNDGHNEYWAASGGPADGLRDFVAAVRRAPS